MVGSNPSCPTFPPSPPPGRPEPTPPLSAQAPIGPSPTCHPSDGMVGSNPSCPTFPPSPPRPDGTNAASQCAGANRPEPHLPPLRRNGWVQPFLPDLSPEPSPRPAGTNAASQCAGANRPEPHLPPLRRNGWVQPFLPDLPPSPPPAGRNQRLLSVRRRQSAPRSVAAQCLRGAERKLEMTRADDLRQVRTLQMRVDTRENSLGNLGALLPGLHRLKLNNSLLASVRDLGTSLARLRVLWVSRCGLEDLDGIGSFASLKELYASYNNISELSPLCLLDQLEILDLEGNSVEEVAQVQLLGLCAQLHTLTLQGNPVCLRPHPRSPAAPDYNCRAEVRRLIPHLRVLDEVPAGRTSPRAAGTPTLDWLMVQEAVKKAGGGLGDGAGPGTSRDPHPA
uniref:Leucine rich repeat containing 56 n=1 Tax=Ornithorhynchus anatinus TaxID=9258 RepID=A0A6I8N226_ORNAN